MRLLLSVCCLSLVAARPATAQALVGLDDPIAQADLLYYAGAPLESYELLLEHVQKHPDDYETLWRIARSAVVVGLQSDDHMKQNQYLDPALHFAARAIAARPGGTDGVYWHGVAAGRRAINAGTRYSVELAEVTYQDAHTLLAADSLHAGAHNMLGKLNFEVMSLSRIKRLIARVFLSDEALENASWEDAERHLARAIEIAPESVLFQFDMGAFYEKRGHEDEAVAHLRQAVELPASEPIDARVKEMAAALLDEIER